jgi:FMN-dependent NADH-azoreductase
MNKAAVVYFSRDGSTKIAADILAERIGADLVELEEQDAKHGFLRSGFRATTGKHASVVGDPWEQIRECDTIVLAAPIWAGSGNPVMNGFLDKASFIGKTVHILTLQADPRLSRSRAVIAHYQERVEEAGGTVAGTRAIAGSSPGRTADAAKIKDALDGWLVQ